jgi:YafQ family addiction module toxin component
MRRFSVEASLKKKISKIFKKDKATYEALMEKMDEILSCADVDHYKNLKRPLEDFKRVHIRSSFVLIFKYMRADDKIIFYDLDHHDNVYRT